MNDERSGEFRVIFIIFKQTIYVMQNLIDYSIRSNKNTCILPIYTIKYLIIYNKIFDFTVQISLKNKMIVTSKISEPVHDFKGQITGKL